MPVMKGRDSHVMVPPHHLSQLLNTVITQIGTKTSNYGSNEKQALSIKIVENKTSFLMQSQVLRGIAGDGAPLNSARLLKVTFMKRIKLMSLFQQRPISLTHNS